MFDYQAYAYLTFDALLTEPFFHKEKEIDGRNRWFHFSW